MEVGITVVAGVMVNHKPAYFIVTQVYDLSIMQEICRTK